MFTSGALRPLRFVVTPRALRKSGTGLQRVGDGAYGPMQVVPARVRVDNVCRNSVQIQCIPMLAL